MSTQFEREQAAERTRVSWELEGLQMSPQAQQIQDQWVRGQITDAELRDQILALHSPPGPTTDSASHDLESVPGRDAFHSE